MVNISIDKFRNYILQVLDNCKSSQLLVSFAFPIENFDIIEGYCSSVKIYEKTFYWEIPSRKTAFYGLGELLSINESGKARFMNVQKKIREHQDNFTCNWKEFDLEEVPLFIGGMKFAPEGDSDLWENYEDAYWFVPKILFLSNNEKTFLIYNLMVSSDSSVQKLEEDYTRRLNWVLQRNDPRNGAAPRMSGVQGNTPKEKKKWIENVKRALAKIESDDFIKIVLSRQLELNLEEEASISFILHQLKKEYPDCYLFAFNSVRSLFFGASPEKLCKIYPHWIETDALAGSAPRGADENEDTQIEKELLKSPKNLKEHEIVTKYISETLLRFSDEVKFNSIPEIKKLNNIQHLWTPIRTRLDSIQKIFSILEALHPSPAVCGIPQNEALNTIKKLEDYPRGLYSGIMGWFNYDGEGEFTVALRSALIKGKKVYAFAGAGIVEGSDPLEEYKETELKFKPILSLFKNEN